MATSQTFDFLYNLGNVDPATNPEYPASIETPVTLTDSIDGNDNGVTDPNNSFDTDFTGSTGVGLFKGLTSNGDPVFQVNGVTYVASDDGHLTGPIGFSEESYTYCFGAGTRIATPTGEECVENLAIGDEILTADGQVVTVKWLGVQTIVPMFHTSERAQLVKLSAGSLGNDLPREDMTVTADHAILIQGVLCQAGALVNGETIVAMTARGQSETFRLYHVETEEHAIILANGTPVETFIDNVARRRFDNYSEFRDLYGEVPEMAELPYPRAMSARQVPPSVRAALRTQTAA